MKKHFVTQPSGTEYFRMREADERAAAGRATNVKARAAHEVMALRYRDMAGNSGTSALKRRRRSPAATGA